MTRLFFFLALALFSVSCNINKMAKASPEPPKEQETEFWDLDTLTITADEPLPASANPKTSFDLPRFNPSSKRVHDLLHTSLDIRFNWEKEQVIGLAELELEPYFYPTNILILDAKNFQINRILLLPSKMELAYDYNGQQIVIQLDKEYEKGEEFKVLVDYIATPTATGGSDAITSDKGLFFINPRKENPNKPQQIWTQGETEHNSRWFPTIDKPNERCTQEIKLTVEDRFTTLSNGLLLESTQNNDGTRTDYWKMNQPHAPYLFMVAVGEFAKVEETWRDIPVEYYVEPEFEEHAKAIYPYTTEMLDFFSSKLDFPYPWEKYAQIVVRDYVSGAMENTTSVIFGEFMQQTTRELIDERINEQIVAHEMMHHWFGDYVTCESWAHLTLNEGFANYSEYLWFEHKYGKDEADYHRLTELEGYLGSARGGIHPLIHFGYRDKEDMFDAHSYNKGGLVLHMLRNYVGDEAFWAALNKYLRDNAYTAVEADELRLAFEDVTGEDLNWFFDQWFFDQGHPDFSIETDYKSLTKKVVLKVMQVQDPNEMPAIFQMPLAVDIYYPNGEKIRQEIFVNERSQEFFFEVEQEPALVVFDADNIVLGQIGHEKSVEEYVFQYRNADGLYNRLEALSLLSQESDNPEVLAIFNEALKDPFWAIRGLALESRLTPTKALGEKYEKMAVEDPHSQIRESALYAMLEGDFRESGIRAAEYAILKDPAIDVISAALEVLIGFEAESALVFADQLSNDESSNILNSVGGIYGASGDLKYLPFFEEKWIKITGFDALQFFSYYAELSMSGGVDTMQMAANKLKEIAVNQENSLWHRLGATKGINDLHAMIMDKAQDEKLDDSFVKLDAALIEMIEAIQKAEKDPQLQDIYSRYPDPKPKP